MKLTKYEHACFTVEKDDQILVVDPGSFTTDFIAPDGVVAIVVTHMHEDHLDHELLANIIDKNPEAVVIGDASVTTTIEVFKTQTVTTGESVTIGAFDLSFFGGKHAIIHASIPGIANLGVIINDLICYPGDSFSLPGKPVDTLALPAAAPWMKTGEAMDYLTTVKPRMIFPTHDAILSSGGKGVSDRLLGGVAKDQGVIYQRLEGPIDI